jgi:hypothetical protein
MYALLCREEGAEQETASRQISMKSTRGIEAA